jgi:hypothetical protein
LNQFTFCLAVAVVSAATADPLVEYISNAGWFGRGSFTDHSTLDVLPALTIGAFLGVLLVIHKVRGALRDRGVGPSHFVRASREALDVGMLPFLCRAFALQIAVLYAMETCEQYVVYGHALGATIWLGGPAPLSLGLHALVCALVAAALARTVRTCAQGALRVIAFIRTRAILVGRDTPAQCRRHATVFGRLAPLARRFGERAPPLPIV